MWLIGVLLWCWCLPCEAKTITVPKTGKNENQLHEELLAAFPQWAPLAQPDGFKVDPGLLRVESTATEVRLTVPDDADEAAVQAVVAAHTPRPRRAAAGAAPNGSDAAIRELEQRIEQLESRLNTRELQDARGRQP